MSEEYQAGLMLPVIGCVVGGVLFVVMLRKLPEISRLRLAAVIILGHSMAIFIFLVNALVAVDGEDLREIGIYDVTILVALIESTALVISILGMILLSIGKANKKIHE